MKNVLQCSNGLEKNIGLLTDLKIKSYDSQGFVLNIKLFEKPLFDWYLKIEQKVINIR